MNKELEEERAAHASTREALNDADAATAHEQRKRMELSDKLEQERHAHRDTRRRLGAVEKDLDTERSEHAKALDRINNLGALLGDVKGELDATKAALDSKTGFALAMEQQRDAVRSELKDADNVLAVASRQLKAEANDLRDQVDALTAERDEANRQLDNAKTSIANLSVKCECHKADAQRLQTLANDRKANLDRTIDALSQAEKDLAAANDKIAELQATDTFKATHYYGSIPYQYLGRALPAGAAKGLIAELVVYRSTEGALYFRSPANFDERMRVAPAEPAWIEHDGTYPRLPDGTMVEYECLGFVGTSIAPSHMVRWNHGGDGNDGPKGAGDIVRYRVKP